MHLLGSLLALFAVPHPGSPLYLQLLVEDDAVELQLFAEQRSLLPLLGFPDAEPFLPPVDDDTLAAAQAAAGPLLADHVVLRIDGSVATLGRVDVRFEGPNPANVEPTVHLRTRYPADAPPRGLRVEWSLFLGGQESSWPVPVLIRHEGDPPDFQELSLREPAFDWVPHAPAAPRTGASAEPLAPAAPGRKGSPAPWRLPLGILGAAGLVGAALRSVRARVVVLALGCAAAGAAWSLGTARPARAALPGEAEAQAVFQALHQRIYDAFAAEGEDAVYELLASAVDRDVLDELYGEVYESLVLRNEGGAFCLVDDVRTLASEVRLFPNEARPVFEVDHSWQVHGTVSHWGHSHERTNVYRARYTVAHDGEGWKIAAWEVLEHRRKDDARSFVTLVGEDPDAEEEDQVDDPPADDPPADDPPADDTERDE